MAGRYTQVNRRGCDIRLLLAKNPAGWLEALDVLAPPPAPVLLAVNAQGPDGRDTSWLWDVDFRRLRGRNVLVGGERRLDLAVRLEADEVPFRLVNDIDEAVDAGARPWRRTSRCSRTTRRSSSTVPSWGGHSDPGRQCTEDTVMRPLRLVWVYPDLLSTYGDRGNVLVLERRARLRGLPVEVVEVNSDQPVPRDGDIYLMGGGEDLPQTLATRRLLADGGLHEAASRGAVVFAVCAGYQMLGMEFGGADGRAGPGTRPARHPQRARASAAPSARSSPTWTPRSTCARLTGFENHQGVTRLGPQARPLARTTLGTGNGDGTEGAYAGRVLGTYLHGPALVRNPGLADLLLHWAAGPLPPLPPQAEELAQRLRAERLAAVSPAQ